MDERKRRAVRAKVQWKQPLGAEVIAEDEGCTTDEVWDLVCTDYAARHGLDLQDLKDAVRRVRAARAALPQSLDPLRRSEGEDGRVLWRASHARQLARARGQLERLAAALRKTREAMSDMFGDPYQEQIDPAGLEAIPEELREHFGDLWEAAGELVDRIELPRGSGTAVGDYDWELMAGEEAARLWESAGHALTWNKNLKRGDDPSPFAGAALQLLLLLGVARPGAVARAAYQRRRQDSA